MKLKMYAFDFEQCILSFRVPSEVMGNNSFGNVPGGVEVDLFAITGNAALGAAELGTSSNTQSAESLCFSCLRFRKSCYPFCKSSVIACLDQLQS